ATLNYITSLPLTRILVQPNRHLRSSSGSSLIPGNLMVCLAQSGFRLHRKWSVDSMTLRYLVGRLFFFVLVIWAGMTLIFFLPKLSPNRDPIRERMGMMVASGGAMAEDVEAMAQAYEEKFGLDKPLWQQYVAY